MDALTERYLVSMGATPSEIQHLATIQLDGIELSKARVEAAQQHPEESGEQCTARAKARLLWPHRPKRVTPGHEFTMVTAELVRLRRLALQLGIPVIALLAALVGLGIFR